ncbi:MAG: alpha/beta fold hydrolase [Bacteroidia bacterium]
MKLHYRELGEGKPLIILHGLFGSSDNWQTLAKKFAERFRVILVDQRNHGHSPKSDEFNYHLLSEDLLELLDDLNIDKANLIGHSMGGKTIMHFAQKHPERIEKMMVVDIAPKQYPSHHDVILEGLNAIDLSVVKSRGEAEKILDNYIQDFSVKQFLLKNLYWEIPGEQLAWRINLPVLTREMGNILSEVPSKDCDVETLFVRGDKSNYILESDFQKIKVQFPNSKIITIEGAGHWIHAEKPLEFYTTTIRYFNA